MVSRKKTKPIQQLLDELDKPLYESRWEDVKQYVRKTSKKVAIPEGFQSFLEALEVTDCYFAGGKGKDDLNEARDKLDQVIGLCQPGDPGDAFLRQLATILRGQVLWVLEDYKGALYAVQEGLRCSGDTTQLHTCKVLLEGTLCTALCTEALCGAHQLKAGDLTHSLDAYEECLRLSVDMLQRGQAQSLSHHPTVAKVMKVCLERGPLVAMRVGDASRAVRFCRKILQAKMESVLKDVRHLCTVSLASIFLFHVSNRSYSAAEVSSLVSGTRHVPSCLPEESLLVCTLAKAYVDTWAVSVNSSLSPMVVFDLLTLSLVDLKLHATLVECLEDGMRFTTASPHLWTQFALALTSNGQVKQALAVFHECVSQFPNDPLTLLTAANFAVGKGERPDLCVEWSNKVVERFKGHFLEARAQFLLGRGYWVLSEQETVSQKRQELHRRGLRHLQAAAEIDSKDIGYSFHLAVCLAESRQLHSAKMEVQRSLTINPGHTGCLHLLALILTAEKAYLEATKICDHALQKQPDNFGLLDCKIRLDMAVDNTSGALASCKAALALWRSLYSEEGSRLIDQVIQDNQSMSEFDTKLQDYANLEMVDPDLASDTGSSQFTMSGPRASVSASNALQARIWCTVADVFLKVGKTSDALSCVREAQFLAPHFPSVLLSYGRVMQASDNEKASGELYRSALALQPTNPIALTLIGQLMYHSKRYDQAEKYLQEATAVDQLNHEAWYWLGEVFSSQGHKELAANCYRTALDLELTAPLQPFSVVLSSLVPSSL